MPFGYLVVATFIVEHDGVVAAWAGEIVAAISAMTSMRERFNGSPRHS